LTHFRSFQLCYVHTCTCIQVCLKRLVCVCITFGNINEHRGFRYFMCQNYLFTCDKYRLFEAAVIVLLIKGLLVNTCYVLVDVLIPVRLHYRLSEAAVILYAISHITCQLNLPLTVWTGCDFSWILLHIYICWPMWFALNFIIVF
jgi:hypothetical protein